MDRMLAEMAPNKQDSFREWLVPSMLLQPMPIVGESAMDAYCNSQLLQAREVRARTVPFNFATEPIPARETTYSLWQGNSDVQLTAVVDNSVFPGNRQRPVIKGVTVSHQTVAIKTKYGVHPRLAKSIMNETWEMVLTKLGCPDCRIGECGLDYTVPPHSLPSQRKLFGKHIAKELEKSLVLHLRGNAHVPF